MRPSSIPIGSEGSRAGQSRPRRLDLEQQLGQSLREFVNAEAGSAGLLLGAVLVALVWANSPLTIFDDVAGVTVIAVLYSEAIDGVA